MIREIKLPKPSTSEPHVTSEATTIVRRNTKQRNAVLAAVRASGKHPTAETVLKLVRKHDASISRATVYRNLNTLVAEGKIGSVRFPEVAQFDHRQEKHHHLRCTQCGKLVDLKIPYEMELDNQIATLCGFQSVSHQTLFEGLCQKCSNENRDTECENNTSNNAQDEV